MALQHVDTVIAFAVVMLGASLVIMVITQTISTVLNLRGKNLFRSLSDLLGTLYPIETGHAEQEIKKAKNLWEEVENLFGALAQLPGAIGKALKGEDTESPSEQISRQILQHPLLSDSSFGTGDLGDEKMSYRLPIAILGALLAGGLGYWGLQSVCATWHASVCAGWHAPLSSCAVALLAFVLIRWLSRDWELASAIRIEELVEMLGRNGTKAAGAAKTASDRMAEISLKIREGSGLHRQLADLEQLSTEHGLQMEPVATQLKTALPALTTIVDEIVKGLGSVDLKARFDKLQELAASLPAQRDELLKLAAARAKLIDLTSQLSDVLARVPQAAEQGMAELTTLFHAAMDRASQRFAVYSRLVTVIVSIVFAFVAHLDAIALFKQLSSDSELRSKLVASSDAMMKQADQILARPEPSAAAPPASVSAAPSAAAPSASASAAPSAPASGVSEAQTCLSKEELSGRVPNLYVSAMLCPRALPGLDVALKDEPAWQDERKKLGAFASSEDAVDFLTERFKGTDSPERQVQTYRENLNALLQDSDVNRLFDQAASVNAQLSRAGIELWPDPYPGLVPRRGELPGLLVAAVLLGLGAPFWFNVLKTLTNLRPLVATREEKERQKKQESS